MDKQSNILRKETSEYISSIAEKMKELNRALESKNIIVEDENKYIRIVIDSTQNILSIDISDILINSTNKKEVIGYIMKNINMAIERSLKHNMEELLNINSPGNYREIISREQPSVREGIIELEREIGLLPQILNAMTKSKISESGNVTINMSGANVLLSMEIAEEYLSKKNKEKVAEEIMETVNRIVRENKQEVRDRIEKSDTKITKIIHGEY